MSRPFDAVLAFSLANLLLYHIWNELLDPGLLYHSRTLPAGQLLAAVCNVALLGTILFALFRVARRSEGMLRLAPVAFWVLVAAWAGLFRLLARPQEGALLGLVGGAAIMAAGAAWMSRRTWGQRVTRAAVVVVSLAFPFALFTTTTVLWRVAAADEDGYADLSRAPRSEPQPAARRIVWVVFDELGQAQAFAQRPAGVEMPVFDRVRQSSFYATRAQSPGTTTLTSLPGFLTGRQVQSAEAEGPSDLKLSIEDGAQSVLWSAAPNVFDSAASQGVDSSLTGWYHPYCRVLGPALDECAWAPGPLLLGALSRDASLGTAMLEQQRETLQWLFRIDTLPWLDDHSRERREVREAQAVFRELLEHGVAAAADPSLGLVFIHLPVPHPPGIYDSEKESLSPDVKTSYADNLEIADLALDEITRAVEQSGTSHNTALIVTADHAWRASFWRKKPDWSELDEASYDGAAEAHVPLMIRLPSGQPYRCSSPVQALRLRSAAEAFLAGKISSVAEIGELMRAEP